jgi:hypothetical protein
MCVFYGLTYLFRPSRILRSARNIFSKQMTDTVFEQRVLEMLKRRAKRHEQLAGASVRNERVSES